MIITVCIYVYLYIRSCGAGADRGRSRNCSAGTPLLGTFYVYGQSSY